jgi:hypothetical protein
LTALRLLLLTLLTAALLAPAAPAAAATPASFFGVMADGPLLAPGVDLDREARLMRSTGVSTVRVAFYWRSLEPRPGEYDWAETDRIVTAMARAGIGVLPVVVRAPAWAAAGDDREGAVPDNAAYARFCAALVARYGPTGSANAGRPIRAWQIWNEPDIPRYWVGKPWPSTYVPLLRAARNAIKAADPGAQIVSAGLTNRSWEDLGELYRAGARGLFDAAAIHPFSRRVSNVVKIVRLARAEMRRRGDARVPLMLTEVSWSSGKGRSTFNYGWETTERGQAARVEAALRALARERTRLGIGGVWWYTWLSPPLGDDESFSYAGLRRVRGGKAVDKPARAAFSRAVRRLTR